jgi:predicted nucleic acid-binding protein
MARWPAYFDTSVLLKRYVQEDGSVEARTLLRQFRCLVSAIAPVEALSALRRRLTDGQLSQREHSRLRALIQRDRAHWELIEVDSQVLVRAEEVVLEATLRILDAIHLASAMCVQAYAGRHLQFVTGDARQRDAAEQFGMQVRWVG